jgi:hypothetical protein
VSSVAILFFNMDTLLFRLLAEQQGGRWNGSRYYSWPGLVRTLARIRVETRPALSCIRATGRLHTYVHEASAARYECAIASRAELPPS